MSSLPTDAEPAPTDEAGGAAGTAVVYIDSSVLVRAYLADEPGHADALGLIEGDDRLVTGTLTLIEVTRLLVRAHRAGRLTSTIDDALAVLADDLGDQGAVTVVRPPDAKVVEASALEIVRGHGIRALDALHVAVALVVLPELSELGDTVAFATRDAEQAGAAEAEGLAVI